MSINVLVVLQSLPFYRCTCFVEGTHSHSHLTPSPMHFEHRRRNRLQEIVCIYDDRHFTLITFCCCMYHTNTTNATTATIYVAMSLDLKHDCPGREWCADKRNWNMSSEDWKWILLFRSYSLYIVCYIRHTLTRSRWIIANDLFGDFFFFILLGTENKYHVI